MQNFKMLFQHFNAKLVPVVTLSINDNTNFWENIKQWFKKKVLRINIDMK